jgi:hypothetical protein
MSKLIGTNPNQVPSNADLGSAAFMDAKDFLTSRGSSLSAIDAVIPKTAVDVFVYDTSKDSDGGAWRKRTQDTSWYNEKLNTTTRGSRKEFPAVALIIVTTSSVTIYDGDDSSLPMWMVFDVNNNVWLKHTSSTNISVAMMNATLVTGGNGATGRASLINFISDDGHVTEGSYNYVHKTIARRNIDPVGSATGDIFIVNNSVNDVSMTVLPNAPIDATTGLPVPTIAVATNGGVSVIKDDGTVVDVTQNHGGTATIDALTIDHVTGAIYFTTDYAGSGTAYKVNAVPIPSSDRAENSAVYNGFQDHFFKIQAGGNHSIPHLINTGSSSEAIDINVLQSTGAGALAVGEGVGLSQILEDPSHLDNSMIAYTASNYATGWMQGNIKLATLADSTGENHIDYVGGSGSFSDAGEWSTYSQWSVSGGTASYSGSGAAYISKIGGPVQEFVYGEWYYAELDVTAGSASTLLLVNRHISGTVKPYAGTTNVDVEFVQLSGTKYFAFWKQNANNKNGISLYATTAVTVDNFKVYKVDTHDRSYYANHLIKYGTLNKTPVATGADLVAYSGFSTSNYMATPRSNITSIGTGDFSVTAWVKRNINSGAMRTLGWATAATSNRFDVYLHSSNKINLYAADGGSAKYITTDTPVEEWFQYTALRRNSSFEIYINGDFRGSVDDSINANYTADLNVWFGIMSFSDGATIEDNPLDGSLALVRVSHTASSAEQIKKMYEDEKVLFQENAKATLYGTSDTVTALAYDDSTDLLHVGTSAGRSVFQGLRRIDNTTDAVGTAISAVNGLVVEE